LRALGFLTINASATSLAGEDAVRHVRQAEWSRSEANSAVLVVHVLLRSSVVGEVDRKYKPDNHPEATNWGAEQC
jgi:hypothetical protein